MAKGEIQDKGNYLEFGKSIRFTDDARIEMTSVELFDDFVVGAGAINSYVPQPWVTTETGTGTAHQIFVSAATGDSTIIGIAGSTANDAQEIAGKRVAWKPSTLATKRPIRFRCRMKETAQTTAGSGTFCLGMADAVTYTSGLPYVVSAASALTTSVPADFVGFFYSSVPTSGALFAATDANYIGYISSINGTDVIGSTGILRDDNYHEYVVEIDADGTTRWYIDGALVFAKAAAITETDALTPYVQCSTISTNKYVTVEIDYIGVNAGREA